MTHMYFHSHTETYTYIHTHTIIYIFVSIIYRFTMWCDTDFLTNFQIIGCLFEGWGWCSKLDSLKSKILEFSFECSVMFLPKLSALTILRLLAYCFKHLMWPAEYFLASFLCTYKEKFTTCNVKDFYLFNLFLRHFQPLNYFRHG